MKRKVVKPIIIAASVAAIVGIGAVSFAAWSASSTDVTGNGTTGVVNTIGAMTVTPSTASGTLANLNDLYPVDQTGGTYLKYWEFKLETAVTGDQAVAYKLKAVMSKGSDAASTNLGSAALYWSTNNTTTTAVEANKLTNEDNTAVSLTGVANGDTIYVYMVASGVDAMKANVTLTFSVEAAASAE